MENQSNVLLEELRLVRNVLDDTIRAFQLNLREDYPGEYEWDWTNDAEELGIPDWFMHLDFTEWEELYGKVEDPLFDRYIEGNYREPFREFMRREQPGQDSNT